MIYCHAFHNVAFCDWTVLVLRDPTAVELCCLKKSKFHPSLSWEDVLGRKERGDRWGRKIQTARRPERNPLKEARTSTNCSNMNVSVLNSSSVNGSAGGCSSLNDSLSDGTITNRSARNCSPMYFSLSNGYSPNCCYSSNGCSSLKGSSLNCFVTNSSSLKRCVANCSSINGSFGNGSAMNSLDCTGFIMNGSINGSYINGCAISSSSLNSSYLSNGLTKNMSAMACAYINSSTIYSSGMNSSRISRSGMNSSTMTISTMNGSTINDSTMNSSTTKDIRLNCSNLDEPFICGSTHEVESFDGKRLVSERFLPTGKFHMNLCSTSMSLEARWKHGVDSNPDQLNSLRSMDFGVCCRRPSSSTKRSIHRTDPESSSQSYLLLPHQTSSPNRLNDEEEEQRLGEGQAPKVALSSSPSVYEDDEPVPVKRFCEGQRSTRSGPFTRRRESPIRKRPLLRNPEDRLNLRRSGSLAVPSRPDVIHFSDVISYHDVTSSSVDVTATKHNRKYVGCRPGSRTMTATVVKTGHHRGQSPDSTSDCYRQEEDLGQYTRREL